MLALLLAAMLTVGLFPVSASAAEGSKLIALTFDDGPDRYDTPVLLEGLAQRGVPVTFFVLGDRAEWYPGVLRQAYEQGHEIGCHSYDHPDLTDLTVAQIRDQFEKSYAALDAVCGEGTEYLVRPPYGSTDSQTREAIDRPLILWNVDTLDWESLNAWKVCQAILDYAEDGAIVLLHDIHRTSVEGALMAIDILLEEGYEFVTVSELYRRRGVELENGKRYYSCRGYSRDAGPIPAPELHFALTEQGVEVTITADTDAPVYYTTDGSYPSGESLRYTGPFLVDRDTRIRAVAAYKLNGSRSETVSAYPGDFPCEDPQIQVENMILTLRQNQGAPIHYTLDGSAPTLDSPLYQGPIAISAGWIRAIAGGGDFQTSGEQRLYCSELGILSADLDPGMWYFDPMNELAARGLMNGVGNHCFAPNQTLTRGMLVTLLYRCSGLSLGDWAQTSAFADVLRDQYYAEAVEWAWRNGIVSGYSESEFRPNGPITRQELCKIVDGYLTFSGAALPRAEGAAAEYEDAALIQPWALESVEAMTASGLLRGNGRGMDPTGTATRAQVATILVRMLEHAENKHGE